jgi:hypothetical protein
VERKRGEDTKEKVFGANEQDKQKPSMLFR